MKQFGEFGLDTLNECLWRSDKPIALPPKPFAVLRYLVEHPGRLITHDELLDALWPETYVQPQVLRTYMLELRKVLGDDAARPRFIQTIPKRGYRFAASVTESADLAAVLSSSAPPTFPQREAATRIVNREEEIAQLRAQFELAAAGQRQLVFITGEAGIGKTALVDAFCEQASSGLAASSARGQCVEGFGSKEEYYPVTEALRQICASPEGDRACRILARMAPAWLAAIGRESVDAALPAPGERMPGDLCAALEEMVAEKPLIFVLEDLQWADDSTLHLISALARRRTHAKLLLIATYRPQEVAAEHPAKGLKQDLRMRRLCAEIALAPLAKPAVRELLIRELQQQELPSRLAGFVHRRSEGNPLFVIAILEHLIARDYLVPEKTSGPLHNPVRWVQTATDEEMGASLPDGLAQMIELEISRLNEQEQRMLEAGSLMSVAFPSWAVAAALEMDPAEAEEACQELARRLYFVERAGEDELPDGTRSTFYVFAHGLYREVLSRKQTEARRAKRHTRIAERLKELFPGREGTVAREMAMHYEAAGNWQRALAALRTAARHALERQAHAEAAELLERALQLTGNLRENEGESVALELCTDLDSAREALRQAQQDIETASRKSLTNSRRELDDFVFKDR